jgi:hypothetical protein
MMKTTTKEPTYTMASLDKIVGYSSQMIIYSCFISMHKKWFDGYDFFNHNFLKYEGVFSSLFMSMSFEDLIDW